MIVEQYSDHSANRVTLTEKSQTPISPKNLTDLQTRVTMLENQQHLEHDSLSQLRRDVSRMRDHIVSLEQHIYNLRNAIR